MRALLLSGLGPAYMNNAYLDGTLFAGDPGAHAKETLRRAGLDDLRLTDFAFEYSGRDYALLRPQRVALPHLTTFTLESILRAGDHDYVHVDLQQVWPDEVVLPPGDFDVVLLSTSYIWNRALLAGMNFRFVY